MAVDTELTDVVRRAGQGEESAWEDLVERFGGLIHAIARSFRLSPADAADVAQMTWLRLFESLARIRQPEAVGSWIGTTARRECLRLLRSRGREVPSEHMDRCVESRGFATPGHDLVRDEERATVRTAVRCLPDKHRRLMTAMLAPGTPSYATIADVLAMPIGSIGPTRVRAMDRLRRDPHIAALAG